MSIRLYCILCLVFFILLLLQGFSPFQQMSYTLWAFRSHWVQLKTVSVHQWAGEMHRLAELQHASFVFMFSLFIRANQLCNFRAEHLNVFCWRCRVPGSSWHLCWVCACVVLLSSAGWMRPLMLQIRCFVSLLLLSLPPSFPLSVSHCLCGVALAIKATQSRGRCPAEELKWKSERKTNKTLGCHCLPLTVSNTFAVLHI